MIASSRSSKDDPKLRVNRDKFRLDRETLQNSGDTGGKAAGERKKTVKRRLGKDLPGDNRSPWAPAATGPRQQVEGPVRQELEIFQGGRCYLLSVNVWPQLWCCLGRPWNQSEDGQHSVRVCPVNHDECFSSNCKTKKFLHKLAL